MYSCHGKKPREEKHWPWRSCPGIIGEHPGGHTGGKRGARPLFTGRLFVRILVIPVPPLTRSLDDDLWRTPRMTKAKPNRPANTTSAVMNRRSIEKSLSYKQDKEGIIIKYTSQLKTQSGQ